MPVSKASAEGLEVIVAWLHPQLGSVELSGASLSAAERQRAARLRSEHDRRRFILAHARLRELLAERAGLPPESLEIEYGSHGKPALAHSDLQFSLSHSGEVAAYAFARGWAIGIDVEAIRPLPGADAIAARTFPRRELRAYTALGVHDKLPGFFRGWTRTEALAKALGGGLTLPPEALDSALEGRAIVCSFAPAPGFAGAVAYL